MSIPAPADTAGEEEQPYYYGTPLERLMYPCGPMSYWPLPPPWMLAAAREPA